MAFAHIEWIVAFTFVELRVYRHRQSTAQGIVLGAYQEFPTGGQKRGFGVLKSPAGSRAEPRTPVGVWAGEIIRLNKIHKNITQQKLM